MHPQLTCRIDQQQTCLEAVFLRNIELQEKGIDRTGCHSGC